jgi:uncharacterized membrane protein
MTSQILPFADKPWTRWALPVGAALVAIAVTGILLAYLVTAGPASHYGWMMGSGGYGWSWMWPAGLLMVVGAVLFLVVIVILLPYSGPNERPLVPATPGPDPFGELRYRYAKGEIDRDRYLQMLRDLRDRP